MVVVVAGPSEGVDVLKCTFSHIQHTAVCRTKSHKSQYQGFRYIGILRSAFMYSR